MNNHNHPLSAVAGTVDGAGEKASTVDKCGTVKPRFTAGFGGRLKPAVNQWTSSWSSSTWSFRWSWRCSVLDNRRRAYFWWSHWCWHCRGDTQPWTRSPGRDPWRVYTLPEQVDALEKLFRTLMRLSDFTSMDSLYFASLIDHLKRRLQRAAKQTSLARFFRRATQ